jgi:hypothetical protein
LLSPAFRRITAALAVKTIEPMRRIFLILSTLLTVSLSACAGGFGGMGGMLGDMLKQPEASRPGTVDAEAAARIISQYRAEHGLGPLRLDPTLMRLAAEHSRRQADRDTMSHALPGEGSFSSRIAAGGFQASMAAENVAAGQDSFAEVFRAWQKSPGHNKNMLLPNISLMGIAVAVQPGGRYHTYWTLELGERYVPRGGGRDGPNAGPAIMFGGR